ncbi:MAG TPA: FAD-binding protein [Gemmatimonadaceae bacterium]|nr:FAD-binding protein [Gemmatimonadaceae bacterium]
MTLRPATAVELADIVRDAHDRHAKLRIAAANTWPERSRLVASDAATLDLSALSGITEYVPGDLTLTARASTTIAEIDAATAAHGQWCPLLPWGGDAGTIGATFSTATHGPCSASLGAPRDLAIGLEFVDGTGALVRAGGRVVKNVAGFDLTRLLVGSWGTLGAITQVSVRLRARPAVDETWSIAISRDARARLDALRRGPLAPLAAEESDGRVLIRLGGNAAFVAASRAAVKALGPAEPCDAGEWTRLRAADPHPRAPLTASALSDALSQRVKKQFDPRHILNPGIMGEGVS